MTKTIDHLQWHKTFISMNIYILWLKKNLEIHYQYLQRKNIIHYDSIYILFPLVVKNILIYDVPSE